MGEMWNLKIVGSKSSVARTLVAKASGPWFDSPMTTEIFCLKPPVIVNGSFYTIIIENVLD